MPYQDDFDDLLRGLAIDISQREQKEPSNELEEWELENRKKFYKQVQQLKLVYNSLLFISKN